MKGGAGINSGDRIEAKKIRNIDPTTPPGIPLSKNRTKGSRNINRNTW